MMGRGKGGGRFRVGLRNHTSLFCRWRHWQADLTAIDQCGELMFGLASRFENSLATVASGKKVFSPPLSGTLLKRAKGPKGPKFTLLVIET